MRIRIPDPEVRIRRSALREKNEDRLNGKNEVSGGKTGIELILVGKVGRN